MPNITTNHAITYTNLQNTAYELTLFFETFYFVKYASSPFNTITGPNLFLTDFGLNTYFSIDAVYRHFDSKY